MRGRKWGKDLGKESGKARKESKLREKKGEKFRKREREKEGGSQDYPTLVFQLFYFVYFSFSVLIFAFVLLALLLCDSCLFGEGAAASERLYTLCCCLVSDDAKQFFFLLRFRKCVSDSVPVECLFVRAVCSRLCSRFYSLWVGCRNFNRNLFFLQLFYLSQVHVLSTYMLRVCCWRLDLKFCVILSRRIEVL